MRQVVFVCPNTGRTTRSQMVEFDTDPLDGIDAADCSECGRAHIVLRQTGSPPIQRDGLAVGAPAAVFTRAEAAKRAR